MISFCIANALLQMGDRQPAASSQQPAASSQQPRADERLNVDNSMTIGCSSILIKNKFKTELDMLGAKTDEFIDVCAIIHEICRKLADLDARLTRIEYAPGGVVCNDLLKESMVDIDAANASPTSKKP